MKNKFEYKQALVHEYKPIQKIKVVINGLWFVLRYDFSVTYKVLVSIFILLLSLLLAQYLNFFMLLVVTGNMLSMEIMNSCIELLCDFHKTGYDNRIKVIKDVAAVAAGISIMVWSGVVGFEIYTLFRLFVL